MFRPESVSVNGRPISAPRGFSSVITGGAANAACAATNNKPTLGRALIFKPRVSPAVCSSGTGTKDFFISPVAALYKRTMPSNPAAASTELSGLKATV